MDLKSWIIATIVSLIGILAPIHLLMVCVGILICIDFVTGIGKAWYKNEPIKSGTMKRTVSKMALYQIAIVSGFLLELIGIGAFLPVSKIVASVIGLVEFKSIIENIEIIAGIKIWDEIKNKLIQDEKDKSGESERHPVRRR